MLFSLFTSMFSWITAGSTTGFYKYETRLTGYVGPINSMAVCARGTLLATGGYDGVVLWNLRRLARLVTPSLQDLHGAVTCVVWLTGSADINQVLAFTTSAGYVFVWKQASTRSIFEAVTHARIGDGKEVISIAKGHSVSGDSYRFATGTRDRRVLVWLLNSSGDLSSVFAVQLVETVPKALYFTNRGDLRVIGLYDGILATLRGKDGSLLPDSKRLFTRVGHAAFSADRGILVDGTEDAFLHFNTFGEQTPKEFLTAAPSKRVPKQIAWGENRSIVVGGGDNGCAYIFDFASTQCVDRLYHSRGQLVQAVATAETPSTYKIFTATSAPSSFPFVTIWSRERGRSQRQRANAAGSYSITSAWTFILLLINLVYNLTRLLIKWTFYMMISFSLAALGIEVLKRMDVSQRSSYLVHYERN